MLMIFIYIRDRTEPSPKNVKIDKGASPKYQ